MSGLTEWQKRRGVTPPKPKKKPTGKSSGASKKKAE